MQKRMWWAVLAVLCLMGLACSMSDIENVSSVAFSSCSIKNGEHVYHCQSAQADVEKAEEIQFNVGNQETAKEITSASVTFNLTVAGQGEAKITVKTAGGEKVSVSANKDKPGTLSADVPLTRKTVRETAEATRTGMDTEAVFFLISVEPVGGKKAEGVQVSAEVSGTR
jgi:hypothetical protein